MAKMARVLLGLLGVIGLLVVTPNPSGAAGPSGLVWPSGPVRVSGAASPFAGSLSVFNPTDRPITVEAPVGQSCDVSITDEGAASVEPFRSGTVLFAVAARADTCADPLGGDATVRFTATTTDPELADDVAFVIAEPSPGGDPKPTGLVVSEEPVVLQIGGSQFRGTLDARNPTGDPVTVAATEVLGGCTITIATTTVDPYGVTPVPVTTEGDCDVLHHEAATVVVEASSADRSKLDGLTVTVQAGLVWSTFAVAIGLAALVTLFAVWFGFRQGNGARRARGDTNAGSTWRIVVDAAPPVSWAANIAAVGTIVTGLFASTDILTGVLGVEPSIQVTTMLIGSAIAVTLAGAAGVLTSTPFSQKEKEPLVWQFVVGAGLSTCGVVTQAIVILVALTRLDTGLPELVVAAIAAVAISLLGAYVVRTVRFYIATYATDPAAVETVEEPSIAVLAAIAAAVGSSYIDKETPVAELDVSAWVEASKRIAAGLTAPAQASVAETLDSELGRLEIELDEPARSALLDSVTSSTRLAAAEPSRPSLGTYIL